MILSLLAWFSSQTGGYSKNETWGISADNLLYLQVWCSYDLDCWLLQTVLNRINWSHLLIGNFSVMSDKTGWNMYVINISETVCNSNKYQVWWKNIIVRCMIMSSDTSGLTQEHKNNKPTVHVADCLFFLKQPLEKKF